MTLKRRLWVCYIHFFIFLFKLRKLKHVDHIGCKTPAPHPEVQIDLVTVAFNNEYLIEKQIKLLKRFVTDEHVSIFIADNSTSIDKRKLIRDVCVENQVGYISIPDNLMLKYVSSSYSHGATLNWIFDNFIKKRQPAIFGFLDHDLFPIAPTSIREKIGKKDFYGLVRDREAGWYLWAGYCFFNYKAVKDFPLDFIPYMAGKTYLDTGGSNFPILYRHYDKDSLPIVPSRDVNIGKGVDYHADYLQYIDECWLHLINGSNWKKNPEGIQRTKENMLDEMTQKYLQ